MPMKLPEILYCNKTCLSRYPNCDGSSTPLDDPADLYDYHIYTNANDMFSKATAFNRVTRSGPKAFVSEYAVTGNDAGQGSLLASLAEAAFLIGIEKNRWNPNAIVFNSFQVYGTPSYWMQLFFSESNGATLLNSSLQATGSNSLIASAITWQNSADKKTCIRIKVAPINSLVQNVGKDMNVMVPPHSFIHIT
ncbi:non-reducing end alpha-L-arabinofuranosidase [Trifolium repens]|nr:non-reducing end alpha-L-arabinofuranosidase [Trifolium repens]